MVFNPTTEAIVTIIGSIPLFISTFITFKEYQKYKERVLLIFTLGWLSFGFWVLFAGLSYLFLIKEFFVYRIFFFIFLAFLLEIGLSIVNSDNINPIKLTILTVFCTLCVYFTLQPKGVTDYVWPNGDLSYGSAGLSRLMINIVTIYLVTIYLYYTSKIFYHSPPELKKYARWNLFGAVIFGPINAIGFIIRIGFIIPGIAEVIIGTGVLISSISLAKKPMLLYVLPFRAMKLMVVESYAGLNLYSYNWTDEMEDTHDILITSALESISIFVRETIRQGDIKEIVLENAVINIRSIPGQGIYLILFSTSSSHVLKSGLDKFAIEFLRKFAHILSQSKSSRLDTSQFLIADELIPICFPYIPKYN